MNINKYKIPIPKAIINPLNSFLPISISSSNVVCSKSYLGNLLAIWSSVILVMAIAQQIKVHRHVEVIARGVLVGAVIKKATTQNIIKQTIHFQSHLTWLHKSIEEISINPKKNDRIKIG